MQVPKCGTAPLFATHRAHSTRYTSKPAVPPAT